MIKELGLDKVIPDIQDIEEYVFLIVSKITALFLYSLKTVLNESFLHEWKMIAL